MTYDERTNDQTAKVAKNLQAFRIAINSHDRENPDHPPAYGIEISAFDAERLGFEDGEVLWPGCTLHTNPERAAGGFRALCDYEEPRATGERVGTDVGVGVG